MVLVVVTAIGVVVCGDGARAGNGRVCDRCGGGGGGGTGGL